MENTVIYIKTVAASIGAILGAFFGELNGLFYALVAFVAADYISGVICAINERKLSSEVGWHGIFKKIMIFVLVGTANILDVYILGQAEILKNATILFYIANEGISLLENASRLGMPVPEKLKNILAQLHKEE